MSVLDTRLYAALFAATWWSTYKRRSSGSEPAPRPASLAGFDLRYRPHLRTIACFAWRGRLPTSRKPTRWVVTTWPRRYGIDRASERVRPHGSLHEYPMYRDW